jgi:hypothetical protein
MKDLVITFLQGLIALLEKLPQKPPLQPEPIQVEERFLLTGQDRELILRFLQSTRLTQADIASDEPKYVHTYGEDQ